MPIYPHSEGYINGGSSEDPRVTEMYEEIPNREVFVKNSDDTMTGTGLLLLEDDTLLAPEGFGTESGSINFGDLITLSEASGFLAIQNNLNGNRYRLVDHFVPKNAPSSTPGYVQMYEAENKIEAQAVSTTILNANPLVFNYTTQLMSRVNSIGFKANTAMTNVRIKITALGPNIAVKYYPSKASWERGTDGISLSVGENLLDFKDTPLLFEPGEQLQFEIQANTVSLLGNPSGVPYLSAMVQRGQFKYLANEDQVPTALSQLSNDAGYLTNSTLPAIPSKTSDLTNDSNFITSIQAPVQSVNGQSGVVTISIPEQVNSDWDSTSGKSLILNKPALSTVAVSGSYSDLSNKPTIPNNTNQLTNGSGFVTASQAASSSPVQSVNGQQGVVTLSIPAAQIQSDWNQVNTAAVDFIKNKPTIPSVVYPVTSVNGKTGAVVLVNTDVGAAGTSHTHAIADVTGLQTSLDSKFAIPAGTTAQYVRGNGSLATFPTIISSFTNDSGYITSAALTALSYRRTETFLGTSDPSGNYTITFSGTYATAPDVQPQIIGGSFNQFIRVVSVNTTGAVVQVAQRNTVTLLSVEVLLGATVPVAGASVSVQVTARA